MTPDAKYFFTQYEEYKREIAELEEKCDMLKPKLISLIPENAKIDSGTGIFTLSSRKVWRYSPDLTALEVEVRERQKEEQQLGIAESEDGAPFIVFKQKKS